ncbi:MAG: carboxylesterase family protein [Pedobacter sp.]|nr:MAG: carboxylesterase family protein [Pedobacter sp.]
MNFTLTLLRVIFTQILLLSFYNASLAQSSEPWSVTVASVAEGKLAGKTLKSGIRVFRGIPYAAPPVGNLRWKLPQPVDEWDGIRPAIDFSARPVQKSGILYEFRSETMDEDCLYLNIWTSAKSDKERLPVYVFIHGGSFIHGDGSQPAYDGESMAKEGVVYVSINYRLGVFGFMSHPELSKESPNGSSGNYGLLDQTAALKWIQKNINAFGGDPNRVTIGGESVGSQSISAHLVSPLSRGLFAGAIAQSGSLLDTRPLTLSLKESEEMGLALARSAKVGSLADLRELSAEHLLKIASKNNPRRFKPVVDGYFLDDFPLNDFTSGNQAKVPLLVGWNADEVPSAALFRFRKATPKNLKKAVERLYGTDAEELLKYYSIKNKKQIRKAGSAIISDHLINYSSWKLADLHANKKAPVYRYLFAHPHPGLTSRKMNSGSFLQVLGKRLINNIIAETAFHAAEIEYALGNLDVQGNYDWDEDDYKVSRQMQSYFVNFIKTGNPNGQGIDQTVLTRWPKLEPKTNEKFMEIGLESKVQSDKSRERYMLLQKLGSPSGE